MNCVLNKECWLSNVCELLGDCVYNHHLVTDYKGLHNRLIQMPESKRAKHILHIFHNLQPPKASPARVFHDIRNQIYIKYGMEPLPFVEKPKKEKYVPEIKWDHKTYKEKIDKINEDIKELNQKDNFYNNEIGKLKQKKLKIGDQISKKTLYKKLLIKEMYENCPQENFHIGAATQEVGSTSDK